ncbi:MAG: ceramidase domain-containing protein [Alphaproteobacteria bacterium]|nr:ceramidase domain-containing protein [Alphaproteobacteria bacterium]NNF23526.1 hypothetical protein [Paracoccaceae bacterium]
MDWHWSQQVDAYCERTDFSFWAEPLNALTNGGFVLAGLILFLRWRGMARGLSAILVVIGVSSLLFHTYATQWASAADVLPILALILTYLYAISRHVWGLKRWAAAGITLGFFPYAAATVPIFALLPGLGSSAAYAPVPLLILIEAAMISRFAPFFARRLAIGALILIVSLTFRTLDMPLCDALPFGTHFVWHILNALMLGYMIEIYARFRRDRGPRSRTA